MDYREWTKGLLLFVLGLLVAGTLLAAWSYDWNEVRVDHTNLHKVSTDAP